MFSQHSVQVHTCLSEGNRNLRTQDVCVCVWQCIRQLYSRLRDVIHTLSSQALIIHIGTWDFSAGQNTALISNCSQYGGQGAFSQSLHFLQCISLSFSFQPILSTHIYFSLVYWDKGIWGNLGAGSRYSIKGAIFQIDFVLMQCLSQKCFCSGFHSNGPVTWKPRILPFFSQIILHDNTNIILLHFYDWQLIFTSDIFTYL